MMAEVTSLLGTPLWVTVWRDDDYDGSGYAYKICEDKDGTSVIDAGHTYDHDYTPALEYACGLAETLEYAAL